MIAYRIHEQRGMDIAFQAETDPLEMPTMKCIKYGSLRLNVNRTEVCESRRLNKQIR